MIEIEQLFQLSNGLIIDSSELNKIINSFYESLKKELPYEAITYESIGFIIDSIKQDVKAKKIVL